MYCVLCNSACTVSSLPVQSALVRIVGLLRRLFRLSVCLLEVRLRSQRHQVGTIQHINCAALLHRASHDRSASRHFSIVLVTLVSIVNTIVDLVLDGDAFKMLPASKAGSRIRGLKLEEDRFPPLALPARPGRIYFKIDETSNSAAWAKVRDERAMATVWSKGRAGQLSMTLVVDTTGNTDG